MGKNTEVFDKDINPVIEIATNEDLQYLVDLLTGAFNNFLDAQDVYKNNRPNHKVYADLIAKEVCEYGGNSFVNLFRGQGPSYKEIVYDVAGKLRAPCGKMQSIEKIEDSIILVIMEKALEKMSDAEKQELLQEMGGKRNLDLTGPALTSAFVTLFRLGGFKSYQITVIVVNAVLKFVIGRGLTLAGNAALTRAMAIFTGPIGWVISGIWTAIDLAGPAYRVTVPAVIYIAMLRKKYNTPLCPYCNQMISVDVKYCPACGVKI